MQMFRILVIIFLPIFGVAIYAGAGLNQAIVEDRDLTRIERDIQVTGEVGSLIHELQNERAEAVYYLTTKSEKEEKVFLAQIEKTDQVITDINFLPPYLLRLPNYSSRFAIKSMLDKKRNEILINQDVDLYEFVINYGEICETLLKGLVGLISNIQYDSLVEYSMAYSSFLRAKEYYNLAFSITITRNTHEGMDPKSVLEYTRDIALGDDHLETSFQLFPGLEDDYNYQMSLHPAVQLYTQNGKRNVEELFNATIDFANANETCESCSPMDYYFWNMTEYFAVLKTIRINTEYTIMQIVKDSKSKANTQVCQKFLALA